MMISLQTTTKDSASSSPLSAAPVEESEPKGLSFSQLLHGATEASKEDISIQNGAFILALDKEGTVDTKSLKGSSKDTLLSLLKGEVKEDDLPLVLNPQVTKELSIQEFKALIKDAKNYLRDKIMASEGFKKSEIENLPKTLKGLTQVAKKFGIDLTKITLQEVRADKDLAKGAESDTQADSLIELQTKKAPKRTKQTHQTQESQLAQDRESQKATQESKSALSSSDLKLKELHAKKATPLFSAQTTKEITTEQLVHTKLATTEVQTPKKKADETLKMLLRGEKVSKSDNRLTADFSVATARVIAPQATTEKSKSLESLLRGDTHESTTSSKLDGLNVSKADSFEVKLNEAKQMTKYLSADVKTAIEDYKSPFTRVKVQLNPQRLGEIDLTVVQRGKNLHINLSSNNAAINALSLNANDLKVQLSNNGINNASLNFNNSSQSSEQGGFGQQQQNSHNEREAQREYNYFNSEEENEEIISSLEIVVPYYA